MAEKKRLTDAVEASLASASQLAADAELARLRSEVASLRGRYKSALAAIDAERLRADSILQLQGIAPAKRSLTKTVKASKHDATMVVLLSDVHCEERQIAKIDRVVVWLGGDFISGHIHDDTAELAQMAPLTATRWIGERLRAFIDAVAENASEVIVATNSGNHGRSTEKLRVGTEMEHSFEQHLYLTLAAAETKPNVRWQVGTGYLNYLNLDGFVVRFHHGHAVKYQGGIGGIHVPLNKSIAAWDATERADLTCLGHWHQFSAGRRYVSNGSVIGHSAYAVRIKAEYERPCQAAIVIDHGRNEVTKAFKLFCDGDLRKGRK